MSTQPITIILMGSKSDLNHCQIIADHCQKFGIQTVMRIASAHKTASRLLALLKEYETDPRPKVYITVAGRSNALSGMADANVCAPVISCPPYSSSFGGVDIYSSLRMPSGVAPMVILEPENAALAAAKILGQSNAEVFENVKEYQENHRNRLYKADEELKSGQK